jgi:hypothetical protein
VGVTSRRMYDFFISFSIKIGVFSYIFIEHRF